MKELLTESGVSGKFVRPGFRTETLAGSDGDCAGAADRDKKAALAPRDGQVSAQPAKELSPLFNLPSGAHSKTRFSRRNVLWLRLL
jgi:hypothetical protein